MAREPTYEELEQRVKKLERETIKSRQIELALKESEERYKSLFKNNHSVMLLINPESGDIVDANPAAISYYGWRHEELTTKKITNINTLTKKQVFQEMERAKKEQSRHFYFQHRLANGNIRDVEVYSGPIQLHGKELLYSIIHDITERKEAEEALRKSEERLRAVFEAAKKVSFIITDAQVPEPIVLEFSPGAEKIFGYSKTEMVGNPVSILHLPNDVAKFPEVHKRMRQGKIGFSGETTLVRKSGKKFPALFTTYPLFNEKGGMYAVLGVSIDISEQKELEAQLWQAHKMESIGTLAGGIAHDFNNILGIILGNTELAMDDVAEWNPARLNLEEVRTASLRAKDVVRQLLSFARKTDPERKPININSVITGALKLLRSSIPTSIEIRSNIPKESQVILADPTQINQVVINLCTNAAQAVEDEDGVIEISLEKVALEESTAQSYGLSPGLYAQLTVNDNGHGIDPEIQDRIFDPYFTTREVGKGSGMGLPVVHGIVMNHEGTILVDSDIGKGATFKVFFPIVETEPLPEITTDEDLPKGKERIILIDDEESILRMGRQRLERLGYMVESTTSPIEALALFRSQPDQFDLVITDLTMPKMTGDKLVKEILNIRPDIPVILCTGFSEKIDEEKAREIGAADYIEKPLDKRDFAFKVRKVLDAE